MAHPFAQFAKAGIHGCLCHTGYSYDAAGNMTHDATSGLNYTYDQENRITGAGGYTYTYDGDGNRVEKANGSTGTLYWYMTLGIVGESDLTGTMKSEYVFFNGERVARRDLVSPTGVFYYFADDLKTASVITDSAGNIKSESDYYPWGGELQFTNNDSNHYKFTGKERDSETGLDYFGARYYSNGLGRFITPDWSAVPVPVPYADLYDPQSLNQYSYVRNIPTVKIDPDGHCPPCGEDVEVDMEMVKQTLQQLGPAAVPAVAAAGPAALLAAPSVGAMTLVVVLPPVQNTPDGSPNPILDALSPSYIPAPPAGTPPPRDALWDWILGKKPPAPTPNTQPTTPPQPQAQQQPQIDAAHRDGKSKRTRDKHQAGTSRDKKARDETHPSRKHYPPRKPPDGHKGPWPPKPKTPKSD